MPEPDTPGPADLQVVATAGHVDHGKSSLILALTGMDPDRLAEEKRRGLTIDLGFAWAGLPSGREVGFVDVPGHERFIRNMLAGVGPVRLVLFVVAADEGWKPQSEEHLQIVDVLGADGGVVALSKADAVDGEALAARTLELEAKLEGTRLAGAPIVACSAHTGAGLPELRDALDRMLAGAPAAERTGRPRQFIDRVFTIKGSGTVVTGTLTGGPIAVGQEAEILPSGHRARIRGLQTHKRSLDTARPVSRVAVNLVGTPKEDLERGDVLTRPGQWRPTSVFEASLMPVRGLDHPLTQRGAFKLYAGSSERDARMRMYGEPELRPGERAFVRIQMGRPLVLDFKDSFVLREAGRRETVAGGQVLDTDPPTRPGPDRVDRLRDRQAGDRSALSWHLVTERGAVKAQDVLLLAGVPAEEPVGRGAVRSGPWLFDPSLVQEASGALVETLRRYHSEHPLREGIEIGEARSALAGRRRVLQDIAAAESLLEALVARGEVRRSSTAVHLPEHRASTAGRDDADRLVSAIQQAEPSPPTMKELAAMGFGLELVRAACADGRLVRVSPDLVVTPEFLARAEELVRGLGRPPGLTVSGFRQRLGTSRKYALPLLEYFDAKGLTRRQGDVRILRG